MVGECLAVKGDDYRLDHRRTSQDVYRFLDQLCLIELAVRVPSKLAASAARAGR
jgi:hypothetical protein